MDSNMIDPEKLLSAKEVCSLLGCSKVSLWRWMQRPDFPLALRFSPMDPRSRLRFSRREILEWARGLRALTSAAARVGNHTRPAAPAGTTE